MKMLDAPRVVFCEGKPESLDQRLLLRLFPSGSVAVQPAGGKGHLPGFVEGFLTTHTAQEYLIYRDRDFDQYPEREPALLSGHHPNGKLVMSHRTCIENYLLDGGLLDRIWTEKHDQYSWKFGPSPGIERLTQWIMEAARALVAYQATRWALASLKPKEGWNTFGNSWVKGDDLPDRVDETSCEARAKGLIEAFSKHNQAITIESFMEKYREFMDRFQTKSFWDERLHAIYFSGKDLAGMMDRLHHGKLPPMKKFFDWAIPEITWRDHPDLLELANRLADPRPE